MRCGILLMTIVLMGVAHGTTATPPLSANAQAVVRGSTAFACDLYKRLATGDENLFFSPYSISCVLGLAYAGARGETAKQIASVLRLPPDETNVHRAWAEIQRHVGTIGATKNVRFVSANGLWTRKGKPFLPSFLNIAAKAYRAEPQQLDFRGAPQASCAAINAWVAELTYGKINQIIGADAIGTNTALLLVNAVYFHGIWHDKFGRGATVPRMFKVANDKVVKVPTMTQEESFAMESRLVDVYLPKFSMDNSMSLPKTLAAMGMQDAFEFGRADFSDMDGTNTLFVYDVKHEARVIVNEDGTKAAAATAVTGSDMFSEESLPSKPKPVVFRADHPFLFFIRDSETGGIYFMGRMVNPQ